MTKTRNNFDDLQLGKFMPSVSLPKQVCSMNTLVGIVRLRCIPPQVACAVVLIVSVAVAGMMSIGTRAGERKQDQVGHVLLCEMTDGNVEVSSIHRSLAQNPSSGDPSSPKASHDSGFTPDPSLGTRFVSGMLRDGFPNFDRGVNVALRHADLLTGSFVQGHADASTSAWPVYFGGHAQESKV